MQDSPLPQQEPTPPRTPPSPEHAATTPQKITPRQQVLILTIIPLATFGIILLITGSISNALLSTLIASHAITIYIAFTHPKPQMGVIIAQTAALCIQLYVTHSAYRTYVKLERELTLVDSAHGTEEPSVLEEQLKRAIQSANEALSEAVAIDPMDESRFTESLLQSRSKLLEMHLNENIRNRLFPERHFPFSPPSVTKVDLNARKLQATIFGSLILMCVGVYLFTIRTHFRTAYGVIEVGFAAMAATTAVPQLLDADGVNGWIGIGASIYLVV